MRLHCYTSVTLHSHSNGYKPYDVWKNIEDSGKMMLYNVYNTCWP